MLGPFVTQASNYRCIPQPVLILKFTVLVENEINKMIIQLLAIFFQFDTWCYKRIVSAIPTKWNCMQFLKVFKQK